MSSNSFEDQIMEGLRPKNKQLQPNNQNPAPSGGPDPHRLAQQAKSEAGQLRKQLAEMKQVLENLQQNQQSGGGASALALSDEDLQETLASSEAFQQTVAKLSAVVTARILGPILNELNQKVWPVVEAFEQQTQLNQSFVDVPVRDRGKVAQRYGRIAALYGTEEGFDPSKALLAARNPDTDSALGLVEEGKVEASFEQFSGRFAREAPSADSDPFAAASADPDDANRGGQTTTSPFEGEGRDRDGEGAGVGKEPSTHRVGSIDLFEHQGVPDRARVGSTQKGNRISVEDAARSAIEELYG